MKIFKRIFKKPVKIEVCEKTHELLDMSNDELRKIYEKHGLKSSVCFAAMTLTHELLKRYWCISEFPKKVVADLEEAMNVSRNTYEKLLLIYLYTIPSICRSDKKGDLFCDSFGSKVFDYLKKLAKSLGIDRENKELLENDRATLKQLVREYYAEMEKRV